MAANTWIGWGLAIAGALAAGPLVLGRGNPALTPAHDEISLMSEVERTALKRKYDQYRALSEDQRTALRSLHQQLEADRPKGGRYLSTMADYCDWLKTIDAWQQDELAHIDDPLKKAKRVDEIAQERQEKALANAAAHDEEGPLRSGLSQAPILLTESQLTKVFDALAQRATGLTEEEQKEIDKESGLKRIGLQVKALKQRLPKLDALFRAIPETELQEMIEASGNADMLALLTNSGDMPRQTRVFMVKRGIVMSVVNQFRRESTAATDEELRAFFNTLPKDEQNDLLELRAEDFKSVLRFRHLAADPVIAELHHLGPQFDIMTFLERMDGRGGFPGPNGPGGPNGGRPGDPSGDRPPFDGRREGDRGGPFNRPNGQRGPGRDDRPPPRPGEEGGPPPDRPEGEGRPPRP